MRQTIPISRLVLADLSISADMAMEKVPHAVLETRMEVIMPFIREQLETGGKVRISPRGVSMLPMLRQGIDTVTLSPVPERLKKYDLPLYQRDDGKYIRHRIVKAGEDYTCIGDNQFVYEPGVRHDQMIAVVTSFTRGDREITVANPLYRLYCCIWHYSRPLRHFWRRGTNWLRRHLSGS